MNLEQATVVALVTSIAGGIFWASKQSGRIDAMKDLIASEFQRRDDRIAACELKANDQGNAIGRIDERTRTMDVKLSRIMGRLGVPYRSSDLDFDPDEDR